MILPPLPPVLQLLASCAVERALPAVIVAVGMRLAASDMEGPMRAAARELASSAAREVDGCTLSPPLREMVRV